MAVILNVRAKQPVITEANVSSELNVMVCVCVCVFMQVQQVAACINEGHESGNAPWTDNNNNRGSSLPHASFVTFLSTLHILVHLTQG